MSAVPASGSMLSGDRVYRIDWLLGTDRLRAICHCSAERDFEDPVELWEWLLAHPASHGTVHSGPEPVPPPVRAPILASR